MDDGERALEIDRLLAQLSEARRRKAVLVSELQDLSTMLGQIREAFGNPYFYSGTSHERPENADKSIANHTGSSSHDVVMPTLLATIRVERELGTIRERLSELGVKVE